MTVSPISPVSIYSSAINYYTQSIAEDEEDLALRNLLYQYDIKPSGDKQIDTVKLHNAMKAQAVSYQSAESESDETVNYDRPWKEIMWQLGLTLNEDPNEDYQDIMDEIDDRMRYAKTDEDYNQLKELKYYAEDLFINEDYGILASSIETTQSAMANINIGILGLF